MNAIEIKNLQKSYGAFHLGPFDLELPAGCIMGLVGENGAGKTTMLRLLLGAARPDAGSAKLLGVESGAKDFARVKEDVGVVLDEAYFPETLTAANVNKVLKNSYRNWDETKFCALLRRFDLPDKKPFCKFSRGMKMKLAIAAALSHDPKLLLLDEATSGLDPLVRDEILDVFNDFTRDETHAVLLSSHIVSDLEKICDYVAFLHEGQLLFCEEKDVLLDEYALLRLPEKELEAVPEDAIVGVKGSGYGAEALVRKNALSAAFPTERASLEDIILFTVKGDMKK